MNLELKHELPFTVTLEMADHRGHLNYIKAFLLFEVAQEETLKSRGTNWADIDRRFGVVSVVRDVNDATFHSQVWPGECVTVRTKLTIEGVRLCFVQEIVRNGVVCISFQLMRVLTKALKPTRIPAKLMEQLFGPTVP